MNKPALWGVVAAALVAAAPELVKLFHKVAWDGVRSELNALPLKKRCVVASITAQVVGMK